MRKDRDTALGLAFLQTIFGRILLTLLLVMLPLYGIAFYIYMKGVETIQDEITRSNVAKVDFMVSHFEGEVRRIRTLQFALSHDRDLLELINKAEILSPYDRSMLILRLVRSLNSVKNSSQYISDIVAYLRPIGLSVSALGNVDHVAPGGYPEMEAYGGASQSQLSLRTGEPRISFGTTLPNNAALLGVEGVQIQIELSRERIESSLDGFADYKSSNAFLYDRKRGTLIAGAKNRALAEVIKSLPEEGDREVMTKRYVVAGETVALFAKDTAYLGLLIGKMVSVEEIFVKLGEYRVWFFAFSIASILIIILAALSAYTYIHKPLSLLVSAFARLETGDFEIKIRHPQIDEFKYLYTGFNDMTLRLKDLIDQVYTQKILAQSSEMRQLQAQINPHFLFNSFFILSTMIKIRDYENAQEFTLHLGKYFQYVTRNDSDLVALESELEHARSYLAIQGARLGGRAKLVMEDLPAGFGPCAVPRLILQPLIENAFEHGIMGIRGSCLVRVSFSADAENRLSIAVEDSGQGASAEDIERLNRIVSGELPGDESVGILNVHRRIRLLFGGASGLSFRRSPYGGVLAELLMETGKKGACTAS